MRSCQLTVLYTMKFCSVFLVIIALQWTIISTDFCRTSLQDCRRDKNDSLADFQEKFVHYQHECEEKEHFQIQFVETESRKYQLEIADIQSFEGLLLQICIEDDVYFLSSTHMHAVSTCNFQNDMYVVAKAMHVQKMFPVYIESPTTATAIRYIVLDHRMCSYQGLMKFDQRQVVNQSYDNAENNELRSKLRKRRQVSSVPPYLLVSNQDIIHQVSLDGRRSHPLVSNLNISVALDYDYRRKKMYWTDVRSLAIMQSNLDGSGIMTLLSQGLATPDGLAADWITNKLYFTDTLLDIVGVFDPVHFFYKVLVPTGSNTKPRAIVLDPNTRMMYWSDWGTVARIERASMDGSNRQVIHNTSLIWPNALTIDYQSQSLYWADAKLDKIERSGVDGRNRTLLTSTGISHPFGIAFHQNVLYISDWGGSTVRVLSSSGGGVNILKILDNCVKAFGIQVVDLDQQTMATNPCETQNGGCSHFCLLSSSSVDYSCACPDGLNMQGNYSCIGVQNVSVSIVPEVIIPGSCASAGYSACCRGNPCLGLPPSCYCDANCHLYGDCCSDIHPDCLTQGYSSYMVVSVRRYMLLFDFMTPTRSKIFLSNLNDSTAIDYHYRMNAIFWSNNVYPGIWRSSLNGSGVIPVLTNNSDIGRIAIDWISDKLYWSDYYRNTINVIDLHTGHQNALFTLSAYQPYDILVDPNSRYIFWADTNSSLTSGRIVRTSMDGSNGFTTLVTTTGIAVITIDSSEQILYWYGGNQLGSVGTDGSNSQIIYGALPLRSTVAFFLSYLENGILLFTVHGSYRLFLIYVNGTYGEVPQTFRGCYGFAGSKVISQNRQPIQGVNPCATNNGGCSDLCLLSANNPKGYSCACHNDTPLAADGETCAETGSVQPPPHQGSCQAAGNTGCCTSGDCRGSPSNCGCDVSCIGFSDCCPDIISLCPNISTPGPGIRNGGIKRGGNPISIYSNGCQSEHDNDDILEDLLMFLSSEFGVVPLGLAKSYAAGSCQEVADASPQKKAGLYWITDGNNTKQEYCNI